MSLRGFEEIGLPPLLTEARASMSSVSSGSSSYSPGWIGCASTRARSDYKERRDAGLFAFIGFSRAEDAAIRASWDVTHYDHAIWQICQDPAVYKPA